MKYLIPSYDRVGRCKTVEYLHSIGVPKDDIFIATQNERDRDAYTRKFGGLAQIIYRDAHNCAGNRNTLVGVLDEGEVGVFLDDDLRSIQRYVMPTGGEKYGHLEDMGLEELRLMCEEAERLIKEGGAWLVGTAWNSNVTLIYRALAQGKRLSWNKTLSGAVLFAVKHSGLVFDEALPCLDDFDLCLRYIAEGKNVVRVTDWIMNKPQDTTEAGGCYEVYQSGKKREVLMELDRRYYPLARHTKDWKSMRVRAGLK